MENKAGFSVVLQTFGPQCITLLLSFREKATESKDRNRRGMLWMKTQNKIYNCSGRESQWELCHML